MDLNNFSFHHKFENTLSEGTDVGSAVRLTLQVEEI